MNCVSFTHLLLLLYQESERSTQVTLFFDSLQLIDLLDESSASSQEDSSPLDITIEHMITREHVCTKSATEVQLPNRNEVVTVL
jgi:hypothetical protein